MDFQLISWSRFFKPSHRTLPEQLVGFSIFLLICLGFEWLHGWVVQLPPAKIWLHKFFQTRWTLPPQAHVIAWTCCFCSWSLAIWSLWRRYSLRILKLEISLFFSQFAFLIFWALSLLVFQESLLALLAVVFLWFNTLLATLLFWKKERVSGQLLFAPFAWIFYTMGMNMIICISNS